MACINTYVCTLYIKVVCHAQTLEKTDAVVLCKIFLIYAPLRLKINVARCLAERERDRRNYDIKKHLPIVDARLWKKAKGVV